MKKMTNLYAKAMEALIEKSRTASSKALFSLIALLFVSSNAWGATLYGKTAVGAGEGTATVEIYYGLSDSGIKQSSKSTSDGSLVEVSYKMGALKWGYCKFIAEPASGYSFEAWYTNSGCTTGKVTKNPYPTPTSKNEGRTDLYYAKFIPVTVNSVYSNPIPEANPLSLVEPGYKTKTVSFQVSNNADSKDDFYEPTIVGEGWSIDSWTLNGNIVNVTVRFTATQTTTQGMHTAQLTLTSKANSTASTTVAAVVDLTPALNANPEELDFGMFTVNVDAKRSQIVTLSFSVNAVHFEKTADMHIAPFSSVLSADNKTLTIYYEPTEVGTGVWEKIITITARNNQNPQLTVSKEIKLKGQAQGITNPEYTCNIADEYKVDDASLDLQNLWTSTSDGSVTYTMESFVPSGENNDRATAPLITDNRYLSLGQAGTLTLKLTQVAAAFYYAGADTKTITITKYANGLRCTGDTWSKTMTFDQTIETVFTANNADYANTPIQVKQTTGENIAQYESGKVKSFHKEGTATWTIWQEEDYKYEAAEPQILTVNVGTAESPDCSIYLFSYTGDEMPVSEFGESRATWSKVGVAKTLYFEGKRSWGDLDASIVPYQKVNGEWHEMASVKGSLDDKYPSAPFERELDPNATAIKFEKSGGVNTVYIRHVYVTSTKYFNIKDCATDEEITSLTMPTNTIGKNATTAEFYIDYSTCADEIKLHSSHPHITFGETGSTTMQFDSNGSGKQKITLTYSADEPEQISATITIYTPYEHKTITITAKTEKEQQELIWSDGFKGNPITIPLMSLVIDSAAVASSGLPVTYSTNNESVIKIADDNKSFEIIAEGTATLTAEQKGDDRFLAVSDTKTINVVDKKIQYIIWGQDFTHGLNVGDEVTFDARAYTADVKNNAFTFDDARSALIQYTCPADNGVISVVDGKMTIIGYGKTTITASLAGDENHFEATPVIKTVHIREINNGECENIPVYAPNKEITFFAFNLEMPEIVEDIELDPANGVPDKLNFYVRGVSYNVAIQYYNGGIDVYESTDGGNTWSNKLGEVWPEKNTTLYSDSIQLSPNATHIRLKRPKGGRGYHFVGGLVVSRKQFIEVEKEIINLGNVAAGAVREGVIRFNYSDVKQDLQVTKANDSQINKLELDKTTIEVDCGATDKDSIAFVFRPMEIGNWSNMVTIKDPKTGKSKTVTLTATVTIGEQQIIWNPETNIQQSTPPQLNAVATSGLPVTYEVTSGTDVASIVDGQVIINKIGTFTITVKAPASSSFKAAELSVNFIVSEETVFIFERDGEWSNEDNWNKKTTLPTENDAVIINANVAISEEATIKSMTINDEMKVTVKTTGKLTIKENGATGTGSGNLIIEATLGDINNSGSSGQVVGAEKLNVRDAYFQMSFDPSGQITYGWYDFVVPFEVNIEDGIFREGNLTNSLQNGVDFIVMEHSETARAAGKKDWKVISGTMYPGKVYTITFDDEVTQNTFLFKKKESAILGGSNSFSAVCSQQGKTEDRGWNGLGNGTLQHKQLMQSEKKVQIYDHTNNTYIEKEADNYIFAIGTSFFMQVEAAQEISFAAATNRPLLAPSREARKTDEFRLALTAEGDGVADHMWVSASEEATNEYAIGHDLLKMGTPTEAKVAQMWAPKGKNNLCDIELPLVQENAYTPLSLFAPKAGTFTLTIEKMPADTKLFLTYEGNIIWDLTADAYTLDLKKGVTNNYGLLLEVNKAPQISTGVEQNQNNSKQATKVMINNQLYIITSNGAIYSVTGKKVQ